MNALSDIQFETMTPSGCLLDHLGLLCRTPARVRKLSLRQLTTGQTASSKDKTCIEGGQSVLVTIRAGASSAGVGIASAEDQRPAENVRRWHRWSVQDPTQSGECLIFGMPQAQDWDLAKTHVGDCFANSRPIDELRLRGGVYMATRREPETGLSWLSFGLNKEQSPRTTLASLGHPNVWMSFSRAMSSLLGRPITERARPWSIAVPIGTGGIENTLIRVGSTNWARLPEENGKSALLARQVDELSGDGRLAQSIYSLVSNKGTAGRAVGVAAEFDFENGTLVGSQYTLRVPDRICHNHLKFRR